MITAVRSRLLWGYFAVFPPLFLSPSAKQPTRIFEVLHLDLPNNYRINHNKGITFATWNTY